MKSVVIINDFDYIQGGASKVAIDTANILSSEYNVYFFSGDTKNDNSLNSSIKKICTNQGEVLKCKNKIKGLINGIYNFKSKKMLKELLKTLDKEKTIIHIHGWTKCLSSSVFKISWKMGFKVVLTLHDYFTACPNGGYFNYKKNKICPFRPMSIKCCKCNCDSRNYFFKLYRILRQFVQNRIVKLNKKLTDVITISDFSEKILRKTLDDKTKIYRVNNPIDLDQKAKKIDYKKNSYYLYVGRISPEKGVDIFCRAISELGLRGIVVGDGPDLKELKKQYPDVEYVGWKNSTEVKEYMKGAKALIFPSRWYEGAPLTPLEAMQYGIPVITSNCNASVDYIRNKRVSLFNIDKDNDLIIKIKQLNNNIDDTKNNLDFKKTYSKLNYKKSLLKCYKKVLNNKGEKK